MPAITSDLRRRAVALTLLAVAGALGAVSSAPAAQAPYGLDIDTANAVLVSTSGNDATGTGTTRNPFRTISRAVPVAAALSQNVYVAAGTYTESVDAVGNVAIIGGFDPANWVLTGATTTVQAPAGTEQAVLASNDKNVVLVRLTLQGPVGQQGTPERANSYGLRAIGGSSVALLGVTATGGTAAVGLNGVSPAGSLQAGSNGDGGGTVTSGHCQSPPGGGSGGSGRSGANGGAGGPGGGFSAGNPLNGVTGSTGGPETTGGDGGAAGSLQDGGDPNPSTNGQAGDDGDPGVAGVNGSVVPDANNHFGGGSDWSGATAGAGGAATDGRGGGGGGGAGARRRPGVFSDYRIAGSGGGGGGGGGQGGAGGGGGQAGGASFGVFLQGSSLVATDSTLTGGPGGNGGNGGSGQAGAHGGDRGAGGPSVNPDCDLGSGSGGPGGRGGDGGRGGGGAGGAGGPSAAIYDGPGAKFALRNSSMVAGQPGRAGSGGAGGQPTAPPGGVTGLTGPTINKSTSDPTLDIDLDGVVDIEDRCPTVPGGVTDLLRNGCPGSILSAGIIGPASVPVNTQAIYTADVKDSLGEPVSYTWSIGGREVGTGATLAYTFTIAGATTVNLVVVDSAGNSLTAGLLVEVIGVTPFVDRDGDGYPSPPDCDDGSPGVHPSASDTPDNGIDENCDGRDAVNLDRDGDGYERPLDCDDANSAIHPGAQETPGNTTDENCDGRADPWPRLAGVKLTWSASAYGRYTVLRRLVVEGAPRKAKLAAKCKGGGCPRRAVKLTTRGRRVSLAAFTKRRLRPKTRITVRIDYPHHASAVLTMTIRAGKLPAVRSLCLAPGERRPSPCA